MTQISFWEDIRLFVSKIDLNSSHVAIKFSRIFLCGGLITPQDLPPKYFRDYILRKKIDNKDSIVLAEEIFNQQFEDGAYSSLLSLETAISSFCSSILIVLESPGAIAELGSFCVIDETKDKLYVIIHQEHNNQNSYIKNGPLKHIEQSRLWSYRWDYYSDSEQGMLSNSLDNIWLALEEEIDVLFTPTVEIKSFNGNEFLHLVVLVSWYTQITFPQSFNKIFENIRVIIPNLKKGNLKLALRLGEIFNIIKKIEVRNEYYIGLIDLDNIDVIALSNQHLDVEKIQFLSEQYLQSIEDSDRKLFAANKIWKEGK